MIHETVAVWAVAAVLRSATVGLLAKAAPAERRTPELDVAAMTNSSSICCPALAPDPAMESCAAIAMVNTCAGFGRTSADPIVSAELAWRNKSPTGTACRECARNATVCDVICAPLRSNRTTCAVTAKFSSLTHYSTW